VIVVDASCIVEVLLVTEIAPIIEARWRGNSTDRQRRALPVRR